ncbi:MAG TPA: hypothetical protein IGS40_08280 [Trichormus sp. M33_DOE_039]|nr:hypothetical protein [Trichormus sp. M33_DOE_039]
MLLIRQPLRGIQNTLRVLFENAFGECGSVSEREGKQATKLQFPQINLGACIILFFG